MKNIKVVKKWFDKVWNQGDVKAVHKMFKRSGMATGLGARTLAGPDDFEAFQQAMLVLIEDVKISIDQSFTSGDWIAVFCTLKAKKRGSQQEVIMPGSCSLRIKKDKIIEAYNHWDFMSFFEQLGMLPEECFATCLQGISIHSSQKAALDS